MATHKKREQADIERLSELESRIGYHFSDSSYLVRAVTRKAYSNEQRQRGLIFPDQEIYSTLGDAVLKLVLTDRLIGKGLGNPEEITRAKEGLERKETLAQIGRALMIGPVILLGKGEQKQLAGDQPYVLAETLEAIIGAIYLDGGYLKAAITIQSWFDSILPRDREESQPIGTSYPLFRPGSQRKSAD